MTTLKKTDLELVHTFDPLTCRHALNGETSVFHCHHYSTLHTQLAMDCNMVDGKALLADVSESTFLPILNKYYKEHNISTIADRVIIAQQYYAAIGLGRFEVSSLGKNSGEVVLLHSHLDEGWKKKWGKSKAPINYMTCGYIQAMFSAILELPEKHFKASEQDSIAMGAERSTFTIVAK